MATKADELFKGLSSAEQKTLQRVFLRIVRPSENGLDTRRRAAFSELPPEGAELVVKLAKERLLVTNQSASDREQTVEVAHEALISNWSTLRAWVNEDREFLLWRERLAELRRRAIAAAGAAALAVILLIISFMMWHASVSARAAAEEQARIADAQRSAAEEQTQIAESRRLAAESSSALAKYPQRSLLLAVEAVNAGQSVHGVLVAAGEQSLREALAFVGGQPLLISQSRTNAVAISRDNHWLVSGSDDGTARLWDLTAKDPSVGAVVLRGHKGTVLAVAISPDNRWLVTGSTDNTARLWRLQVKDLIDSARSIVGRNFIANEWRLYFHDEPYHKTFTDLQGVTDIAKGTTLPQPHLEFSYEYSFPDPNGPGPREWLKITDDDWIERFPNGVENKLRRQGSEVVDGDSGTVFFLLKDPDLLYFVPDKGSATLWIRDRRLSAGDGKWSFLGRMVFPAD